MDAARQMLDELMGRNRNLHPSEAVRKINWDDPDFCLYYIVKFCPHDLFVNTRADLGPCHRLHDDEAREMYEKARPCVRKRQFEDDFLRFCLTMINDVDRKIQKGKQRLLLMQRDNPSAGTHVSKYQEQLNNLNARIKKLLSEAEEAGTRGDVDQAQDLMTLCEQLKEEKDGLVAQHEAAKASDRAALLNSEDTSSPRNDMAAADDAVDKKTTPTNVNPWVIENGTMPEKQMEVCEVCGAFLIVGDAQQRIEDHLMGKQHLGYSKLRQAVDEIQQRRQEEREQNRSQRGSSSGEHAGRSSSMHNDVDRRGDYRRMEHRGQHRNRYDNRTSDRRDFRDQRHSYRRDNRYDDRHSRHHKSHHHHHHNHRSHSRNHSRNRNDSREREYSRSRSRSHSRH